MKSLTITEAFRQQIGTRRVERAFFATYAFEPDFFELEVMPLLLGNPALSPNETLRYCQLQSLMRRDRGRWAVAYDVDVFDPGLAPRLEVDYLPVRVGGGCQHAKLAVLQLKEKERDGGGESLLLAAGSFNLTKAGWWENLEVGHWVELRPGDAPRNIVAPLLESLDFFLAQRPVAPTGSDALQALRTFVEEQLKPTADDPGCAFYFSGAGAGRRHFADFIAANTRGRGMLEVVSPFFAERGDEPDVRGFLSRFAQARVLLPLDQEGKARVDEEAVYKTLPSATIAWAQWLPRLRDSHVKIPNQYRRLHAKIYRTLGEAPWCFVGSVNLSFKAFRHNVEAGFLLNGSSPEPMLEPLEQVSTEFGKPEDEAPGTGEGAADTAAMPVIHLAYDWQDNTLSVRSDASGRLVLHDGSAGVLAAFALEAGRDAAQHLPSLRERLERSSLVEAEWRADGAAGSARRMLLVSQHNVFCRPTYLPALDLQALLRIFQGMNESARLEMMAGLAAGMVRLERDGVVMDENLPDLLGNAAPESFFSEFSQVNGAFWVLGRRLEQARMAGDAQTLAYFLKGCQPDSLRKVLESVRPAADGKAPSLIVRYLTLLSVDELLQRYPEQADPALAAEVRQAIEALEETELRAQLQVGDKDRFLAWFRKKFRQPVADMTRIGNGSAGGQ